MGFSYEHAPPFNLTAYETSKPQIDNGLDLMTGKFKVANSTNGPITSISRNGKKIIEREYDATGQLIYVKGKNGSQSLETMLTRDDFGRKTSVSHSNGLNGSYTYDQLNRITSVSWSGAGESMSSTLSYSKAGEITSNVREAATFDYGYSQNGQLTSITQTAGTSLGNLVNRTFTYDKAGNRTGDSALGNGEFEHNVQVIGSGFEFYSDVNGMGQVTQKSNSTEDQLFDYAPEGRLRKFVAYDNTGVEVIRAEYFYDPFGRRILKRKTVSGTTTSKSYAHLGLQHKILIAKTSGGSETVYIDGLGIDEHLGEVGTSVVKAYTTDHLGSMLNTAAAGTKNVYGPYGENLGTIVDRNDSTSPVIYGYTGRELDEESQLYYYRARYYDSSVGRVLPRDPIGFSGGDFNLYRYVYNNPVKYTDSLGLRVDYGGYVVTNPNVRENLNRANENIVNRGIPDNSFVIQITGGDRYRDTSGSIRSVTNNRIVPNSSQTSPHLLERGARAVDLGVSGVSEGEFREALRGTDFNQVTPPSSYRENPHFHLSLPNLRNFDGPYSNIDDLVDSDSLNTGTSGGLLCGP